GFTPLISDGIGREASVMSVKVSPHPLCQRFHPLQSCDGPSAVSSDQRGWSSGESRQNRGERNSRATPHVVAPWSFGYFDPRPGLSRRDQRPAGRAERVAWVRSAFSSPATSLF